MRGAAELSVGEAIAEAADDAELGVAAGVRAGCLNCNSIGEIVAFPRDSNVLTVIRPCLKCSALSVGRSWRVLLRRAFKAFRRLDDNAALTNIRRCVSDQAS